MGWIHARGERPENSEAVPDQLLGEIRRAEDRLRAHYDAHPVDIVARYARDLEVAVLRDECAMSTAELLAWFSERDELEWLAEYFGERGWSALSGKKAHAALAWAQHAAFTRG